MGFVFLFLVIISCKKEEVYYNVYLVETYQKLLEGLELDCPSGTSDNYFYATIAGQETCYLEGVDEKQLIFGITAKFTTSSPSFNTNSQPPSDLRRAAFLSIRNSPVIYGEDYVQFEFPDYEFHRDTVEYLDSIFSIEYHEIRSHESEVDKFKVELSMVDVVQESGGGINFPISSRFGNQEESYLRFRKVESFRENGHTYYYIEMEVECKLYHWPQNGKEGLWGTIENGIFVATLKAT